MSALNAIYACKLYRTHANKDKIKAAMESPLNVELVQQLAEYLNDDGVAELNRSKNSEGSSSKPLNQNKSQDLDDTPSTRSAPTPNVGDTPVDDDSIANNGPNPVVDDNTVTDIDSEEVGEIEDVEQSTKISGHSVNSATTLYNNDSTHSVLTMSSVAEVLKGTLNSRQDTAGVIRAKVKENELWLHYNDLVNLNTVMVPVIEFMNAAGYNYLNFNRLARSENAIVFEICLADTDVTVMGAEKDDEQ